MRTRIQDNYLNYAEYRKNDNGTISDIPTRFRYKNFEGKKSKFVQEQLIEGFQSTDEGRMIETVSNIEFKLTDKVDINGVRYEIQEIAVQSDEMLRYGAIRNRANRDIKVLVLS